MLCTPQLQSKSHYIANRLVKTWHVRLGYANNMHLLSLGGHKRKKYKKNNEKREFRFLGFAKWVAAVIYTGVSSRQLRMEWATSSTVLQPPQLPSKVQEQGSTSE